MSLIPSATPPTENGRPAYHHEPGTQEPHTLVQATGTTPPDSLSLVSFPDYMEVWVQDVWLYKTTLTAGGKPSYLATPRVIAIPSQWIG